MSPPSPVLPDSSVVKGALEGLAGPQAAGQAAPGGVKLREQTRPAAGAVRHGLGLPARTWLCHFLAPVPPLTERHHSEPFKVRTCRKEEEKQGPKTFPNLAIS